MTTDNRLTQTEGTNCSMVEETVSGSSTPPSTGWQNLQINSYSKLGSDFKKTPRDPISQSLQLQKPMLVDEDSGLSFEVDITKHHLDRFAKAMFRSQPKHNGNKEMSLYKLLGVTSTGFTVSALGDIAQHFLVYIRGTAKNDGLYEVGAGSTGTETKAPGTTAETTPANATMELVGYRCATGVGQLDTDGNFVNAGIDLATWNLQEFQFVYFGSDSTDNEFATLEFRGAAQIAKGGNATHKLTFSRRSWEVDSHALLDLATETTNDDTVVESILTGVGGNDITLEFIGDGDPATKAYLALATAHIDTVIQAKTAGVAGNLITVEIVAGAPTAAGVLTEVGTHVKLQFKATVTATTVANLETLIATSTLIEVKTAGTALNVLDATDVSASRVLALGTDADAATYGEVSTDISVHFTPGATTVGDVEALIVADSTLIRIKAPGTGATILQATVDEFGPTDLDGGNSGSDDGAGKRIDVYFGRYYRNVARNHDDFFKGTHFFEIEFEDLAPNGDPEYWYPRGNALDECVLNFPLTSKATMNLTWMGMTTPNPTTSRKTGPSSALDANSSVGASTSVDLSRITIDDVDDTGISTDLESLKLTIKNNVSVQKQLAQLGGTKIIHGQCQVTAEIGMIFTTDEAIRAVRDNRTCRSATLIQTPDWGAMFDIHAMSLDTSGVQLAKNKAVMLNVKTTGFMNDLSGATIGMTMFPYLPARSTDDE